MIDREQLGELRGALRLGDGATLVALVRDGRLLAEAGALQMIGDGLVAALADQVDGAAELAADCAARLRARGWTGDDELADQLEGRSTRELRPVPIDLEQLIMVFEDSEGGRLDLQTGEAWPEYTFDYATTGMETTEEEEEEEDEDRWLYIDSGSHDGYLDMQEFIRTRVDGRLAERLEEAIRGRGAFRRFRDVLADHDRIHEFHVFSDEHLRGRARAWLADAGIAVAPRRPRPAP
ncbi:UPF0158 family protein [Pseudonocardia kunmingensis]|uniref:Uncharacterized protein UPF0158 n=1 Tax=Pseudonocardia kunmingensis TaxID=630975 RepID=A0A543DI60_9PSEU|nr:UPF0158 family protein [Pseudonocardia kunmingensis]TQM09001.1 uncharacterized protein UPF0158 [Pseudonocardia kunmingensis]